MRMTGKVLFLFLLAGVSVGHNVSRRQKWTYDKMLSGLADVTRLYKRNRDTVLQYLNTSMEPMSLKKKTPSEFKEILDRGTDILERLDSTKLLCEKWIGGLGSDSKPQLITSFEYVCENEVELLKLLNATVLNMESKGPPVISFVQGKLCCNKSCPCPVNKSVDDVDAFLSKEIIALLS